MCIILFANFQAKHFIDFKRIRITGGSGGNGCRSFLSLFADEFAGPDGGDGGYGGDIIFQGQLSQGRTVYEYNYI